MQISKKIAVFIFLLIFANVGWAETTTQAGAKPANVIQADSADLALIKSIDHSYQEAKTISMDLKKSIRVELLDKTSKSSGKVFFSKGRMRMELESPEKGLVVIDKKHIWVVNYPSDEFKNSALQIIQADVSTKKGRSQNFLGLLTQGGILKYFNVSGIQKNSAEEKVFFLQPNQASVEFKRAQIFVNPKTKFITGLKYWDELDNETAYEFSNVKFNKKLEEKNFVYHPPKNADVTHF